MDTILSTKQLKNLKVASFAIVLVALLALPIASLSGPALQAAPAAHTLAFAAQDEGPIADAGGNQTAYKGDRVTLNGSASWGFEGPENLNYTWKLTLLGRVRTLYGMVNSTILNQTGAALVVLTVTDSLNQTSTDTIYVFVLERPLTWFEAHLLMIIIGAILVGTLGSLAYVFVGRSVRHEALLTEAEKEKFHLALRRWMKIFRQLVKAPMGLIGIVILVFFFGMAIFGPIIAGDVKSIQSGNDFLEPSPEHWLGTDNFGIDIFHELLYGARTSIIVGVVSALIASLLGAGVGLYSGYAGGWKDEVVMRLNDIVLSIPWLVLMIIVAAFIGEIDLTGIILIIGLTGWSYTARVVRAQVLSVKERQYIERARSVGASDLSIIRRHIFPNTFPLVFANTILTVAVSILSEATLSFLGLRPEKEVTWGTMLSYASESSAFQIGLHWWILAPGLCIVVVVLGFTLLGYALDEILNPKLRHR